MFVSTTSFSYSYLISFVLLKSHLSQYNLDSSDHIKKSQGYKVFYTYSDAISFESEEEITSPESAFTNST